jgi:hypothetical protein
MLQQHANHHHHSATGPKLSRSEKMNSQILRIRLERDFSKQRQCQMLEEKYKKLKQLKKVFFQRQNDFIKDNSVRTYAPYMRSSEMPTYLLVLQSKVLKSLHQVCVLEEQKVLVEAQSKRTVAGMRKEVLKLGEEQTQLELQMLNCMVKIQSEEQSMHKSYESLLSVQTEELEVLQEAVDEDDELEQLIDQIANESVMALKYEQEREAAAIESRRRDFEASSSNTSSSKSSFRLRTPTRKKKTKKLSLQEMLSTGEKEKKTMHTSITDNSTDDDSSSLMSFSVKMSQSLGFIFDSSNKRSINNSREAAPSSSSLSIEDL